MEAAASTRYKDAALQASLNVDLTSSLVALQLEHHAAAAAMCCLLLLLLLCSSWQIASLNFPPFQPHTLCCCCHCRCCKLQQCWAFSACMALIGAITAYTAQRHSLPADWDVTDSVTAQGSGPQGPAAAAAVRQLAAAVAAERSEKAAAAGEGAKGSSTRRSTESDK